MNHTNWIQTLSLTLTWTRPTRDPDQTRYNPSPDSNTANPKKRFFIFIFLFSFFTKIYFRFRNLQEYTPAAPLLGGRDLAARQRGGRGISGKKIRGENWAQVPGGRSPGSGAAGPGRPAAGRPALPPLYKGWLVPPFASLKFQKPRRKREGGRDAKLCRIFEPATAGNQNSSTLYK